MNLADKEAIVYSATANIVNPFEFKEYLPPPPENVLAGKGNFPRFTDITLVLKLQSARFKYFCADF